MFYYCVEFKKNGVWKKYLGVLRVATNFFAVMGKKIKLDFDDISGRRGRRRRGIVHHDGDRKVRSRDRLSQGTIAATLISRITREYSS